jgi:hypothetical protein
MAAHVKSASTLARLSFVVSRAGDNARHALGIGMMALMWLPLVPQHHHCSRLKEVCISDVEIFGAIGVGPTAIAGHFHIAFKEAGKSTPFAEYANSVTVVVRSNHCTVGGLFTYARLSLRIAHRHAMRARSEKAQKYKRTRLLRDTWVVAEAQVTSRYTALGRRRCRPKPGPVTSTGARL